MHALVDRSLEPADLANSAIVVFGFSGLGDLVRCHSLIQMIAEKYSNRPIDIVARRPAIEIAAFMPEIREAIGEDFQHSRLNPIARLALANELRDRGYGTAYVIPSSFKAALVPFLARIPERIGWSQEFRLPMLTRPRFRMRRLARMVDRICWLGVAEGKTPPPIWPEPRLKVPSSLRAEFESIFEKARPVAPVVAIAPGSSDWNKNWPVENYAAIARRCVQVGCTVWIVGATGHRRLAAAISQSAPVRDRLTDSLTTLALNLAAADIFVGNDSGPLHVAAAFGKPSVGVFGLTDAADNAPINDVVKIAVPEYAIARDSTAATYWPSLEPVIRRLDRAIESVQRVRHTGKQPLYPFGISTAGNASAR
jgi:lipopolysaccharide heptosyltransferase II